MAADFDPLPSPENAISFSNPQPSAEKNLPSVVGVQIFWEQP